MDAEFFRDNFVVVAISTAVGIVGTLVVQGLLSRRSKFRYVVNHERVGLSADDAVFGEVRVTWNGTVVANLYSSTIRLKNESLSDFENVRIRAFSNDSILLTEQTHLEDTTETLKWSPEYSSKLTVPPGEDVSEDQWKLHGMRREYLVPVFNRGQTIQLQYLNAPKADESPTVWLDIQHPGVRAEIGVSLPETYGVPIPYAAVAGILLSLPFVAVVIAYVDSLPVATVVSLAWGFAAQVPGAGAIRFWRWARSILFG